MNSMDIEKAADGSFVMKHHLSLKKKHESKDGFHGGYREPETHTAANAKELMAHVQKHFGGKVGPMTADKGAVKPGEADADYDAEGD
jgi:hypothetical protein